MQTASILLALGGDGTMQVPKFGVTPAEVLLLRAIHGEDAVTEIDIQEDDDRSSRDEHERLFAEYAKADPSGSVRSPQLAALFPGVGAKLPEKFSDIDLDDNFYKAQDRKTPEKADAENEGDASYKSMKVDDLKALAEDRGVDLGDAKKKDEIIAKLEEADAAQGGDDQNLFQ